MNPLQKEYGEWSPKAHPGRCHNCNTYGEVFSYPAQSPQGQPSVLCFVCHKHPPATTTEMRTILGAISTAFQIIAKPKLPPKPKAPRLMKRNKGTP